MNRRIAVLLACLAASNAALADSGLVEPQPLSQVWVNAGFATAHFDRDRDLNGNNRGLGLEYRFSTVWSATAGRFYNSDRTYSNYAGAYYQPWHVGPVRLGAVVGAFDGYPNFRDGGWFPALLPAASVEYKRIGLNVAFIPSYKDRLYGGISLQLKLKLVD